MPAMDCEEKMNDKDRSSNQGQLKEHSLPGTNQAGKGPDSCETSDPKTNSGSVSPQHETHLKKHSLPGTNQAGKGPASDEKAAG